MQTPRQLSASQPTAGQLDEAAALAFLTSRIDYERSLAIPYGKRDFRLERMHDLLARLGNPQDALKIVHIAGTKGKGSTAAWSRACSPLPGIALDCTVPRISTGWKSGWRSMASSARPPNWWSW
jgi:hypothetical protein